MPDSSRFILSARWRKFALMLLGIALLLTSFTLYLQTQHAFKHVILPFIGRILPGHLDAEQGLLTFPGMIQLSGLSYQNSDSGLSVRINRLFLRVSALALLRDRELLVEDLAIEHGDVRMATAPERQDDQVTRASGKATVLVFPWAVQRMQFNDLALSIQTEDSEFTADNMNLAAGEIGPGRSGTVDLHGDLKLNHRADQAFWAGKIILKGSIEQSPDRSQIKWNGTNDVVLQEWPLRGTTATAGPITIRHSLSGSYDVAEATGRHDSSLTVDQGKTHLGKLSLRLTHTGASAGAVTDLAVAFQEITADALNLGLVGERPQKLRANHLSGHLNIHAEGEQYAISSTITGKQLQVVTETAETQPLDIDALQGGVVDRKSGRITLDRFQLLVAENGQPRLSGELSRPLTILFGGETLQTEGALAEASSNGEGTITIHKFNVPEARQWLHVFGVDRFTGVSAGTLLGGVAVSSRDNGRAIDVNAKLMISNVALDSSKRGATTGPMTLAQEFHGTVRDLTMLEIKSLTITAALRNQVKGAVTLSGAINLKDPMAHPSLKGSLGLADLPGEILNPLLARWTDTRFAHSRLDGTAQVEVTGERVAWQIQLGGRQIALWLPEVDQSTVPLDVDVAQRGNVDWTAGILQIDEATARVFERSRPVITAALSKPVRLPLPTESQDQTLPRIDTQPADFNLEVRHLDLQHIRSRLSLMNIKALDQVQSGHADAQLTIQWKGLSQPALVTGYLDLTHVRLDTGAVRILKPLQFRTRIDAAVTELTSVQFKNVNLQAMDGSNLLAATGLTGSANLRDTSMNLAVSFSAGDIPILLARLGLLDEQQRNLFASGKMEAEGRVTSQGRNHPLSLQVTARGREVRFQPLPGRFLDYALLAQGDLEVNGARTTVELKPVNFTIEATGKGAGTLNVTGLWPLASNGSAGSLHLIAKNLDIGPVADLSDSLPGRVPGSLPINGDVIVALEPRHDTLTLRGEEIIGPLRVARKDGGQSPATIRIGHDLTRNNQTIHFKNVSLSADRAPGIPDDVRATGHVRLTEKQDGQIKGHIVSLDAEWYAALLSAPQSSPPPESPQRSTTQEKERQSPGLAMLLGLDADLAIGSISYGKLLIGPGRLTSQGTPEQRHVRLEPTGFADGKIEASLELEGRTGRSEFTWIGKGQALNVEKLLQALQPDQGPSLKGTGSFTTSGRGPLNADPLLKHLAGTFDFDIENGKFLRSPLLRFLSQYTHIQAIEQMGFDGLKGKIRLEDGWIHGDSLTATGTVASLDGNISISPANTVDGRIFAKIGPSFSKSIKIPCMSALLKTPDGFTTLPFGVDIKGPLENLSYSVDTAGWKYTKGALGALSDTMMNLLQGCREDNPEEKAKSESRTMPER